jgi:hypothetical protein
MMFINHVRLTDNRPTSMPRQTVRGPQHNAKLAEDHDSAARQSVAAVGAGACPSRNGLTVIRSRQNAEVATEPSCRAVNLHCATSEE